MTIVDRYELDEAVALLEARNARQARREAAIKRQGEESAAVAARLGWTFPKPTIKAHTLVGEGATVEVTR